MKLSHVFSYFTLVSHWNSNSRLKLYSVYFQLSGILTNAADVFMRQIKGVDMSALPNVGETIAFPIKEDLGLYTRQSDGVSGMTVTGDWVATDAVGEVKECLYLGKSIQR
jgi:hypothetical protein